MPVAPVASASPIGERQFSLPDEAATVAFGERFAAALRANPDSATASSAAHTASATPPSAATAARASDAFPTSNPTEAESGTGCPWGGLHVHLLGDLGAGKTTLVRAMLHALGHRGRVRSPTYTLVEPYRIEIADEPESSAPDRRTASDTEAPIAKLSDAEMPSAYDGAPEPRSTQASPPKRACDVYHFDLYRFVDPAEWAEAGFREYFNEGALCLVEWPQKAGTLIGVPDLSLTLDLAGDGRVLTARAYSTRGKECLDRC